MKSKKYVRLPVIAALVLTLILTTAIPAFAAAPEKESVKYKGDGKVEVEFWKDVDYRNVKVTVKDTSGNKYKASIIDRDDDELKFKVKNFKKGKTYKFTISGVRAEYTDSFGKVTGTFNIKKSSSSSITAAKAKKIALKNAGVSASQVWDLDVEKERDFGQTYYEVTFDTAKYEYEYHISLKGKILHKEKERD